MHSKWNSLVYFAKKDFQWTEKYLTKDTVTHMQNENLLKTPFYN